MVLLAAESNCVHGNVPAAQRGDGIQINSAGIIGAVAQQYHSSDGQVCGFIRQLFETIPDTRYRRRCVEFIQAVDAVQLAVHTIKPRLEPLLQTGEHAALERFDGFRLSGAAVFCNSHASGVIDNHGDDVLLRLQLGDHQSRLPQQREQESGEGGLQKPQDSHAPTSESRNGFGKFGSEQ